MKNSMKVITSILSVILISSIIISCNKESINPNESMPISNKEDVTQSTVETKSNTIYLSSSTIQQIGALHNQYLDECFTNFNYQSSDLIAELNSQMLSVSTSGLSQAEKTNILATHANYDRTYLENSLNDPIAINYIDQMDAALNSSSNMNQAYQAIGAIKVSIQNDQNLNQKSICLVYAEVLMKSAYFWADLTAGGGGIGAGIMTNLDNGGPQRIKPWVVALIDAAGGGAGAVVDHFTNPGNDPLETAVTVGFFAAAASATAVIIGN